MAWEKYIYNLNDITVECRYKWPKYASISWTNDTRIPKSVDEYIPPGRRHVGRPTKSWRDQHIWRENKRGWFIYPVAAADDASDDNDGDGVGGVGVGGSQEMYHEVAAI